MNIQCESMNVLVTQSCSTLCNPMDCSRLLCPWNSCLEFSWQEYWSVLTFPSPEDLPSPGIEPAFSTLQEHSLLSELLGKPQIYNREL